MISPRASTTPAVGPSPEDPEVPALRVQGLEKSFRGAGGHRQRVLRGVNLQAHSGRVTTLLGTYGAGKSTTLACAQGLTRPDSGKVSLLGQQPWRAPSSLRARVGVMLQDGGLPPAQRPLSYLRHVAGLYAHPRHVGELAGLLGIDEFARTPIRRLSGGQKQRVALAVALVGDPEVIFLDEPSAGLDPLSRKVVFDLIATLRAEGRAIVLTTHLLEDAERLSDTIYVIDRGRTVAHGSVEELVGENESSELVVGFDPGTEPGWPDGLDVRREGNGRWVIRGISTPGQLHALTRGWEDQGLMPRRLQLRRRTLEEAFLELAEADTEAGTSGGTGGRP